MVFTGNSACCWFLIHPNLSAKMTRWLEFFGEFDFELQHKKGVTNVVADALRVLQSDQQLSVRSRFTIFFHLDGQVLVNGSASFSSIDSQAPVSFVPTVASTFLTMEEYAEFAQDIKQSYAKYVECLKIIQALYRGEKGIQDL